jgi:flagellar biosynthesis/type III secretory pathway M-ring protein FliF/YscJ
MSNSQGEAQMQTFGEAKTSFIDVVQSSFASLAQMFGISQLKESFYQNIIYILIVIVIMIGILVYVQMVGIESKGPLFSPPTKEIKKVEGDIEKKEIQMAELETEMASMDFSNLELVNSQNAKYEQLKKELEGLMEKWENLAAE